MSPVDPVPAEPARFSRCLVPLGPVVTRAELASLKQILNIVLNYSGLLRVLYLSMLEISGPLIRKIIEKVHISK